MNLFLTLNGTAKERCAKNFLNLKPTMRSDTFIYLIVSRLNEVEEIADVDWFQKGNFCKEEST